MNACPNTFELITDQNSSMSSSANVLDLTNGT